MAVDTLLAVITATAESQGANALWSTTDFAPTPTPAPTYSSGNANVETSQTGSAWTGVRANLGKRSGKWYFEIEIVSDGSAGAQPFAVGLATSEAAIGAEPGSDAFTMGAFGNVGTARVKHNATTTDDGSADTYGVATNIGVCVDLESRCVWIFAGATYWGGGDPELGTLPTFSAMVAASWVPAVWSKHTTKFKFVHASFQYTPPAGYRTDWYAIDYVSTVRRLSNNGYSAYDSATWRHFAARIKGDPVLERAVGCVAWGDRKVNGSFGEIVLFNNDGGMDYLLSEQGWRGAKVELYEGEKSGALTDFTRTGVLYVDDIRAAGERELRMTLRDRSIKLDVPANPNGNPLVLGVAYSCPVTAMATGTYNYIASEYEFVAFNAVRDKGVLLDFATGWGYLPSSAGQYGLDLVTEPAGKVVADVYGSPILDSAIITGASGGDFSSWTSGAPDGWTTVETGGDTVKEVSQKARFLVETSQSGSIAQGSIVTDTSYLYRVDVTTWTSGTLELIESTGSASWWPYISSAGRHQGIATGVSGSAAIKIRTKPSTGVDMIIDEVRVWSVRPTIYARTAIIYLLGIAGIAESDFTDADATAIQQKYVYTMGGCWPRAESIANILNDYAQSWCGWWYFDTDDKFRIGRLKGPDAAASLTLTSDMIFGDVVPDIDRAPGLSSIVAGQRNWAPYADDELVPVGASMTAATRADLQKEFRIRASGAGTLAPEYAHAVGASSMGRCTPEAQRVKSGIATLWNSQEDCQTLADELTSIYSQLRKFYRVSAFLSRAEAYALKIGQTVSLESSRFGMSAGTKLLVVGISRRPLSNLVTLRLWG